MNSDSMPPSFNRIAEPPTAEWFEKQAAPEHPHVIWIPFGKNSCVAFATDLRQWRVNDMPVFRFPDEDEYCVHIYTPDGGTQIRAMWNPDLSKLLRPSEP